MNLETEQIELNEELHTSYRISKLKFLLEKYKISKGSIDKHSQSIVDI